MAYMETPQGHGRQQEAFDLRTARINAGLSATQLAELTGASRSTIFRLEKHSLTHPRPEVVKRVADYFNVTVVELLGEDRQAA